MSDEPTTPDFLLGKLTGQVRELIHQMANIQATINTIGEKVIKSSSVPDDIKELKAAVASLQANDNQRSGATNIIKWLASSPLLPWAVVIAGAVWTYLRGFR